MKDRIWRYRLFAVVAIGLVVSACSAIPAPAVVALSTEATTEAVTTPALVDVTTESASTADVMPETVEDNIDASGENSNEAVVPWPVTGLTEAEAASLRYMREEEKLAHDVYLTLFKVWGLPIFQNIANSESSHAAAVLRLLERYGLDDPAAGNAAGVFTDPTLQALYEQLTTQGRQSLDEALKVGAAIEEIDIIGAQTARGNGGVQASGGRRGRQP